MKLGFWSGWGKPISLRIGATGGGGDTTAPTCAITSTASGATAAAFTCTFTFSESVSGFALGDITVGNGTAGTFAGSGAVYTAVITPTALGTVTVDVGAGVCQDAAGNNNTAATQFSILYINPLMWLKADSLALNDNDTVTTWTDQSGNANSPTQATEANKPLYKTNILNGKPVVRGDGSDDYMKKAFTLNQPHTTFVVFKLITEGADETIFDGENINTMRFQETAAATDDFRIYAGAGITITHPSVANFRIASFRINGASSRASIGTTAASGNAGAVNATGITLFANGSNGNNANADIAEHIVFSGAMSDANMNLVGSYLAAKYALTWTNF